ncbi:hypothetical protein KSP39_PZI005336 [Platanthera zijinensis]|uniref:Uncharacterized protein n=1 Tax=Platanthera zijinensis TaxID=2320716 RepID=A0AAP0BVB9_9ASPA
MLYCFPSVSIPPEIEREAEIEKRNMEVEAPVRCTAGSASSSPEFEFWMVRNPSLHPPDLLTADELFVDGVLLPLQLLSLPCSERSADLPHSNPPGPPAEPTASITYSSASISRRWKDLFKSSPEKKKERRKKVPNKSASGGGSADLNINLNIWPFTRSRSAVGRPHSAAFIASRKVSSAPCSRSNSNGESTGGMLRGGSTARSASVHLGRSSPVSQLRQGGTVCAKEKERLWIPSVSGGAGGNGGTAGVRVLNLNVNSCIGLGNQVSSPGEASDEITGGSGRAAEGSSGGSGSMFNLRAVFSKKVV